MATATKGGSLWASDVHGALVIVKKNARLYYLKSPVLIFGVLFPIFFFLTFLLGRGPGGLDADAIVPGMLAMALWFTASAVGPLVTPWERRARTYERLISTPISLKAIVCGDVFSGFIFGLGFSMVPVLLGRILTGARVSAFPLAAGGVVLGALAFSALGVLLAAPPVSSPSHIMMLSNLVRLPLLFLSGIFIPIAQMPAWARWLAPLSPLSYAADLIRRGYGQAGYFPPWLDFTALLAFAVLLVAASCWFHRRTRAKGL
ncbi:MAG: ABC transporter permease [Candidatus Brocadiae bacterium]|nr:ABC transporter permease [Candidatus Brocadiia bacterium]